MKQWYVAVLVLFFVLIGCSSYQEEFTLSGEITKIEEEFVYIEDHPPIIVNNSSDFKVGQKVQATLIDRTREDAWNPLDFRLKEIKVIE